MPPKAPNLKFKPKLVSQPKQPAPSAPSPDWEGLSLVQLERLRRQQEEEGNDAQSSVADAFATGAVAEGAPAASAESASVPSRPRAEHHSTAGPSHHASGAPTATSTASPVQRKSAAAQLHEASGRYFDMDQYSKCAACLPVNTINEILGDADEGETMHEGQPRIYRPTPITSTVDSSADPYAAAVAAASAPDLGQQPTSTAAAKDAEVDGVAFLRAAEDEFRAACAANKSFYDSHLAEASSAPGEGHLTWIQLPRFRGPNAPFVLQDLPPGKVGQLKVLRSGRVVLELAGVYYEVWVDDDGHEGGTCSTVAVTQPPSHPMEPDSLPSCYEVGMIEKKLVCVPTVEKT